MTGHAALWCLTAMMRLLLILLFGLLLPGFPALAQRAAPPATAPAASPPQAGISADQARLALDVMNDPAKRAAFTATLEAIIRAQGATPSQSGAASAPASPATASRVPASPAAANPTAASPVPGVPAPGAAVAPAAAPAEPKPAAEVSALPLEPDSLGAQLLVSASGLLNTLGLQIRQAVHAIRSLPLLWGWIEVMVTSPLAQDFLIDTIWRVLLGLAVAIAVQRGVRHLLRHPIKRLEDAGWPVAEKSTPLDELVDAEPHDGMVRAEAGEIEPPPRYARGSAVFASLRRAPRVMGRVGLELLPVLATALAGHLFAGSGLGGQSSTRLIILAVIDSYAVCTAILRVSRILLLPSESHFALANPSPETADRLILWIRRLAVGAIVAYAFGEVGFLLGLSPVAHLALQKAVGLYVVVILGVLSIKYRRPVRDRLAGAQDKPGRFATLRLRLARLWHWAACALLGGGWLIWALERQGNTAYFLRTVMFSVLIIVGSRIVQLALHGLLEKGLSIVAADGKDYGILAQRVRAYHRVLHTMLSIAVNIVTVLSLLQLYGLGALSWVLTSALGQRMLAALATVLVTIALALTVWEMSNAAVQSHISRLERDAERTKSARVRTLLPLLRSALIVVIALITGLMVLSEIGVNIAPLLAGAGIIGLAVGLGSQKLVQDLITGIFLLLENAMQVGDVVKVGELIGTVESLSVRTIRLRSEDGSVHVVPFSTVNTVTNMTREFSRTVLQVTVAYAESYDRVLGVLRQIVQEMRDEPAWSGIILDDLEVLGIDRMENTSITIRCRIKCTAFGRWSVGREFNRRMKEAFELEGIQLPAAAATATANAVVRG